MTQETMIRVMFGEQGVDHLRTLLPKTNAKSIGFFILEALNHYLEMHGVTPLGADLCDARDMGFVAQQDGAPQKYVVELGFVGDAERSILALAKAHIPVNGAAWVSVIMATYADFLESRPEGRANKKPLRPPNPALH